MRTQDKMKRKVQNKSGMPSVVKLIIYLLIITALCFFTCLFTRADENPAPREEVSF
jgi:hypothetical protein